LPELLRERAARGPNREHCSPCWRGGVPDEAPVTSANFLVSCCIFLAPDLAFILVDVGARILAVMSPGRTFTSTGAHCLPPVR
jgi:hypothetical protein